LPWARDKEHLKMELKEVRCGQCNKLLAKGWAKEAEIELRCPRCGTFFLLRAMSPNSAPHAGQNGKYDGKQIR
jgi:phage FluMu protein Com